MNITSEKGKIFVISGPSGSGKSTITREILKKPNTVFSVSMTNREKRDGEIDGVHYYFVDDKEFDKTILENGFLEHAEIYNHKYGTPKAPCLANLEKGLDVILEIEMEGALQVKKNYNDAVLIFILPPSLNELRERIIARGTDSMDEIEKRMDGTIRELGYLKNYDYFVINDDFQDAMKNVESIMKAEKCKVSNLTDEVINEYLKEK